MISTSHERENCFSKYSYTFFRSFVGRVFSTRLVTIPISMKYWYPYQMSHVSKTRTLTHNGRFNDVSKASRIWIALKEI